MKYKTLLQLLLSLLLCNISVTYSLSDETLEIVKEEELKQLFIEEKYVITLLNAEEVCSAECRTLEKALVSIREDLVEGTGGWVIRCRAPSVSKELGLKGPAIIYVREGKPMLYEGNGDEEGLLSFLLNNKISIVHNLTDASFEHETQAGTGATTGDWLVMFTRRDCTECKKLYPVIETVSVNLKGRKNVAVVERENGAVTARRFGVKSFPSFILFRVGKLYRYITPIQDIKSLTAFALDTFRNSKGEDVPQPKSPFDDVTEAAADWLRENPWTFIMSAVVVVLVIAVLFLLNRPPPESWTKKNKKKKQ